MAAPATTLTIAHKVKMYIRIRDAKAAAKKEFDKSVAKMNQAMQKLEGDILTELNAQGGESIRTEFGTAYKNIVSSASVKDREQFEEFCRESGNEAAMDIRANKKIVRELLQAGTVVPGVNYTETTTIGIRRS